MSLFKYVLRTLENNVFKTWVVSLCAGLVAAFAIAATLVLGGARQSLDLALQRLGADIIVVPAGAESKVENALLMGAPVRAWMPESTLSVIRGLEGVSVATPQVYLATLRGATCCSLPEMFLIAYDPQTDFTLTPWLTRHLNGGLALNDVVGGAFVYVPEGDDQIFIYGTGVDLKGNLEQTGTGMDATMFLTMDTAREISRLSREKAEAPLVIEPDSVSAVLIRLAPNVDPGVVAQKIRATLPLVTPIESASLVATQRQQMSTLLKSIAALLVIVWTLSIVLTGVIFSLAVNDRRREMGVLAALGARKTTLVSAMLGEVTILALAGGLLGASFGGLVVFLFHNLIAQTMRVQFLLPRPLSMLGLVAAVIGLTLLSVVLAVIWPAYRIGAMEPASAMRE